MSALPRKQHGRDVALCQKRTFRTAVENFVIRSPRRRSFEWSWARRRQARLCGLEVEHELEFGGLHDRQVGGLRATEDLAGVDAGVT